MFDDDHEVLQATNTNTNKNNTRENVYYGDVIVTKSLVREFTWEFIWFRHSTYLMTWTASSSSDWLGPWVRDVRSNEVKRYRAV